jgi:hypothetical protein
MAAFLKFEKFSEDLARGVHNLGTGAIKVYLSNAAPNLATHTIKADLAEIAGGNGYTATGHSITPTVTRSGGTTTLGGTDIVITASGAVGPFRYAILYNDTPTSPVDPLIGYWDYGSAISLANGETFTVDFGAAVLTVV